MCRYCGTAEEILRRHADETERVLDDLLDAVDAA